MVKMTRVRGPARIVTSLASILMALALVSCGGAVRGGSVVPVAPLPAADPGRVQVLTAVDNVLTALAIRDYPRLGGYLKLDAGRLAAVRGDPVAGGQLAARLLLGPNVELAQIRAWTAEQIAIELAPDGQTAQARISLTISFRQKLNRRPREVELVLRLCRDGQAWLIEL